MKHCCNADVARFDSESKGRRSGCDSNLCVLESSRAPTRKGILSIFISYLYKQNYNS